eukprot:COSAG06_NODE_1328_length_9852_cov_590.986158_3_plen_68_part_00
MQQQWAALEALYTAKRAKAIGATNAFAEPFGILKTDQFTKTGLGQNIGKLEAKSCFGQVYRTTSRLA